ncbi:MAG: XrtA system polysaccharide deacetylase [Thiohalomonadaceae bacterium]
MDVPAGPNAMTVDVEDYYQVSAFADRVRPADWPAFEPRVARNTFRLLALFENAGVRATFFVLGWVAERNPGLVREIAAAGHEVACHGYSHELIYRQTPAQFHQETRRAKEVLEDQAQVPVIGYRAASYSIVEQSRWALDVLHELGFLYDSSIFPVRHDRYGIPHAPLDPHRIRTPRGAQLTEFPPTAVDRFGVRFPVGGGWFRLYPYALTRRLLRHVMHERPFMFYVHPWEIDPQQPRIGAGPRSRFRHYLNLHRCEARLKRLLRDFPLAPAREVLERAALLPPRQTPLARAHG